MGNTATTCGDDDDDDNDLPSFFSEHIFIQILVYLPVMSLLRFKSVCKSWCALIETPFFIDLHITTSTLKSSSSKFGSFILHAFESGYSPIRDPEDWYPPTLFMLSGGAETGWDTPTTVDIYKMEYLGFPPIYNMDYPNPSPFIRMVGSCNGLICIHDIILRNVTLWNPATRQFRILPKSMTIEEKHKNEDMGDQFGKDFVAFGFDVKTKDYKVVQFCCFTPSKSFSDKRKGYECACRVQVYNLSTDSWRLLEDIYYMLEINIPSRQNQGIYMNGCYFFVGKDEFEYFQNHGKVVVCNNSLMYSFDFTKEILTTMQFPDHDSRHDLILSCLGDKMALFMIQRNLLRRGHHGSEFHDCGLDYEYYHIWVLKEQHTSSGYGVGDVNKESWD